MTTPVALLGDMIPTDPDRIDDGVAARVAELGFDGIGLHLGAGLGLDPEDVSPAACGRVREVFDVHALPVLHSWTFGANLVRPSEIDRQRALHLLEGAFRVAADLGADATIGGCGSLDPRGGYAPHPENHSEQARETLIENLQTAAELAERFGVTLALECHVLTTLDTPETARAIVDAVDSELVRVNLDPVNLLADVRMLHDSAEHARRILRVLGDVAVSGHVKDAGVGDEFVVHISEAPLGEGAYDVRAFVEEFVRKLPRAPLFIEHLPAALVPRAKAMLDGILATAASGAGRA